MGDYEIPPNGEAQQLLSSPLLSGILDEFKKNATDTAIYTNDDELRKSKALEVRLIDDLRRKLNTLAKGKIKPKKKPLF